MALNPAARYPSQIATGDGGYPLGKARDVSVAGDGTGTPLEKDWLNDIWGFFQSLLVETAIAASGTPDKVGFGLSQYLQAIQTLVNRVGVHVVERQGGWIHVPLAPTFINSFWAGATNGYLSQVDVTSVGTLVFPIPAFFGAKITAMRARILPATGRAALPTSPPLIQFQKIDGISPPFSGSTVIGSQIDPSVSVAAYETAHYLSLAGLAESYVSSNLYAVKIQGEQDTGSNAVIGLRLYTLEMQLAPDPA